MKYFILGLIKLYCIIGHNIYSYFLHQLKNLKLFLELKSLQALTMKIFQRFLFQISEGIRNFVFKSLMLLKNLHLTHLNSSSIR